MRTLKLWAIVTALLFVLGGCSLVETETLEALFTYSPETPGVGETVTFDASESTGENLTHDWTIDENPVAGGVLLDFAFQEAGSHLVKLTITDQWGATNSMEEVVIVEEPAAVTARFEMTPERKPVKGQEVSLDGSSSTGSDLSFKWVITSASVVKEGETVYHTFDTSGEHTVTLYTYRSSIDDIDPSDEPDPSPYWDKASESVTVVDQALEIIDYWIRDYEELVGVAKNVSGNQITDCVGRVIFHSDTQTSSTEIETSDLGFHDISESDPLQPSKFTDISAICYDCDRDTGPKARSAEARILYCEYS